MIGIGLGIDWAIKKARRIDPSTTAFVSRVNAAGGSLTPTEQTAINQLVVDLKAKGLWDSMKAIYPMVGSSAAACAQNLKSSSFTGTFYGGWTFSNNGVTGNGINAYINTGFNPSTQLTSTSVHLSYYQRTENNGYQIGCTEFDYSKRFAITSLGTDDFIQIGSAAVSTAYTSTKAFYIGTRLDTNIKLYKNNSVIITTTNNGLLPNINVALNTNNQGVGQNNFSGAQSAFCSLGDGLTDTQASDFYTIVQAFNTTLSRQV